MTNIRWPNRIMLGTPKPPAAPPSPPREHAVRERVHAAALRLGLILRSYIQQPERREELRRTITEMLGEMRAARNPLVPPGQAPEGTVDAETDRLASLLGALLVVLERLESLEAASAAERRTAGKLEEIRGEWQKAQDELVSIEARAERAESERARLEQELQAARGQSAGSASGDHYRLKKEIDRLAGQLEQGREERESLKKKLEAATKLAADYQTRLVGAKRQLEQEKEEMQRQVEQRIAGAERAAEEKVEDLKATSKERYERRISLLERENKELQARLETARSEWERARRRLEAETATAVATKEAIARRVSGEDDISARKVSATEEIERLRARRRVGRPADEPTGERKNE
jgi:DNA repair exonuclease SbcCD ATPase subunit